MVFLKRPPVHLQEMYNQSKKTLTSEQAANVKKAWLEFADVFASCNLDIGGFTVLVYYLKTGKSFPIKQSVRQTPLGFEKQEKATLDQMLAAGVIEHSHSRWACSASTYIRRLLEVLHWFEGCKLKNWKRCIPITLDLRSVWTVCLIRLVFAPWIWIPGIGRFQSWKKTNVRHNLLPNFGCTNL